MEVDSDVVVIGAGPAGSAAALALARRKRRVILLEREKFPRFHIGESLLATVNECFDELGLTERIRAANFPQKLGANLATHDVESTRIVDFTTSKEVRRGQTWQVCREKFDQILMEAVRDAGADVRESNRVDDCIFAENEVIVKLTDEHGKPQELRTRAVVDASGRYGILARKFHLRQEEPRLANVAVFSHYFNVPRLPEGRSGDIRIVARQDAGWFWAIPIGDELMSVGVVVPKLLFTEKAARAPEQFLLDCFQDTPVLADLMKNATRQWPVRVERDFSYCSTEYAGDRWLLVGDAGSFLDPVFSTGVSIALESGMEAGFSLDAAIHRNRFKRSMYCSFESRQVRRYRAFRRFVISFYTPWFRDLFFQPAAPPAIFQAVVTLLAGRWNPSLLTKFLLSLFFAFVRIQRHYPIVPILTARDEGAGFQLD